LSAELSTTVGSLTLANPVMTASGTAGHGAELASYFDLSRLGAVVVKSLASFSWPGNPAPRVAPLTVGMLNAVGLQGPGLAAWAAEDLPKLAATGARVVVSVWGRSVEDFAEAGQILARILADDRLSSGSLVAAEVNVSCPNLEDRSRMFAHSPSATASAVEAVRSGGAALPLWVKLSPNTGDLLEVAAAALGAGAEALTLVNTLLGYHVDLATRRPVLGAGGGGLSGPGLHPVALRAVRDCRSAFPDAGIVGAGGVADGAGALRMLMAGADAVQVGTATLADPRAPVKVLAALEEELSRRGFESVREAVGAALSDEPDLTDDKWRRDGDDD
jgi:dihydroorotate dehydrogenase (NAD+) catalytic subunit